MGYFSDDCFDAALSIIKDNCNQVHFCSEEPTTYLEAVNNTLAVKVNPTFTALINGPTNGRMVGVNQFVDATTPASGTVTHIALLDTVNERLLYVSNVEPNRMVVQGNLQAMQNFNIIFKDPE